MAGRVRVREISDDEGNRLKRIVRRGSGSVVTWRRAQMVLWSAQDMSVAQIAGLAFTSEDRVRDVLHNFSADGFDSLYPRYAGGRPPVFTLAQRREIKKIAKSAPADHGLPFSRWSLAKLADFLVAEGVAEDIWFAPASLEVAMSANCLQVYQKPVPYNRFSHTLSEAYLRSMSEAVPRYTTAPSPSWQSSHHRLPASPS